MDTHSSSNDSEITVLLVNDSERFLEALKEFLTAQARLKVIGTAQGGDEAIQLIQKQGPPRVILIDFHMPDRSGLQVIPALREMVPDACIIMLSLESSPRLKQAALAAGANDYVVKDKALEELIPAIQRCAGAKA